MVQISETPSSCQRDHRNMIDRSPAARPGSTVLALASPDHASAGCVVVGEKALACQTYLIRPCSSLSTRCQPERGDQARGLWVWLIARREFAQAQAIPVAVGRGRGSSSLYRWHRIISSSSASRAGAGALKRKRHPGPTRPH